MAVVLLGRYHDTNSFIKGMSYRPKEGTFSVALRDSWCQGLRRVGSSGEF